jgi:hypothetical protein
MKEIVTPKGVLKYRMPNILEAYDLLDASGVNQGNLNILKLKRNIICEMSCLLDFSSIEGVSSYEGLLLDVENMIGPLSEIADEVISKTFDVFKKKN